MPKIPGSNAAATPCLALIIMDDLLTITLCTHPATWMCQPYRWYRNALKYEGALQRCCQTLIIHQCNARTSSLCSILRASVLSQTATPASCTAAAADDLAADCASLRGGAARLHGMPLVVGHSFNPCHAFV